MTHAGPVALDHQVVFGPFGIEVELVLEARTAAAGHRNPAGTACRVRRSTMSLMRSTARSRE
jgi:hypothetical protein